MRSVNLLHILTLFAILLLSSCKQSPPLHNKRVMILGNSITQNARYVDVMEYYLRKNYPNQSLDIISIGLSSETVNGKSEEGHPWPRPCIHSRIDSALALIQPDLVMACYGMNDGLFANHDDQRFEAYKEGIYALIDKIEAWGAEVILLTPTVFDSTSTRNPVSYDGEPHSYQHPYFLYNEVLRSFANWLLSIKDVSVIDLFHPMELELIAAKKNKPDSTFIPDGVHPNLSGHFIMAKTILADLYPALSIPEPQTAIKELNADPFFKLVSQRRQIRSEGWRNYIGYTREKKVKEHDISTTINNVKELEFQLNDMLKRAR